MGIVFQKSTLKSYLGYLSQKLRVQSELHPFNRSAHLVSCFLSEGSEWYRIDLKRAWDNSRSIWYHSEPSEDPTLDPRINNGKGINLEPGKFGKNLRPFLMKKQEKIIFMIFYTKFNKSKAF